MYCTMFCNLECILEANDSDLLTHLLSYLHSRDAIASKNIYSKDFMLNFRLWKL